MNKARHETKRENERQTPKQRHPFTLSNSTQETVERMKTFPERAAEFLEQLNADREKNAR